MRKNICAARRIVVGGVLCAVAMSSVLAGEANSADGDPSGGIFNAVVKLEVSGSMADPTIPWQSVKNAGDGSGVVIDEGRILTCAHCVVGATYIRIRKHSEDSLYKGTVEFVDHDCDLALVKVADPAFMNDIKPMRLGVTPSEQAHVFAVGYPLGGQGMSFTEGVISRVEDRQYSHSIRPLLAIQVDAAINPGNSGGPVLDSESGLICGIAFQGDERGEALGYLIPPDVIRHFLCDIEDGVVNGFCDWFFKAEELESEAARRYYGMTDGQTGIRICHVDEGSGANSLSVGDILLAVDGRKVANNGNIRIEGNKPRSWYFPFTMKQVGQSVTVTVLRAGKVLYLEVPILKMKRCTRGFLYERMPDYFVFGGFAFSTVSYDFLLKVKTGFNADAFRPQSFDGEEDVALVRVFPDDCVEGYLGNEGVLVRSVNGVKVKNLKHLVKLIENCRDQFVRFGIDTGDNWESQFVVETEQMRKATPRVMRNYQIPSDRSADLK